MSLYDDIKACEASLGMRPDLAEACIYFAAVNLHYGPIVGPPVCPAGPEPDPPQPVAETVKRTIHPFGIAGQDAADVERYVSERYDQAMARWADSIKACAGGTGVDVDGDKLPRTNSGGVPTSAAADGWLFLLAGIALIAASKAK